MKLKGISLLFAGMLFVSLFSCTDVKAQVETKVDEISGQINTAFVEARDAVAKLDKAVEDAFAKYDLNDFSIEGMEVEDGGKYDYFEDVVYYKPEDDGKGTVHVTGATPMNDDMKRKIKLLENVQDVLVDTPKSTDALVMSWIFTPEDICIGSSWIDTISAIPVGLSFYAMPWAQMGYEKMTWTPDTFTDIAGRGWFLTLATPVMVDGTREAVVTSDVVLADISKKYIEDEEDMLIFMSPSSLLIGFSAGVEKEKIEIKKLADVDYLTQMQNNTFAQDEYKLTNESQDKGIQELAQKVMDGESGFDTKIGGKTYYVSARKVDEVGFYVIGLAAK